MSNRIALRLGRSLVRFVEIGVEVRLNALYPVKLALTVHYTDNYPDELPELFLDPIEGEVDEDEIKTLLDNAQAIVSMLAHPLISCLRLT